MPVLLSSKQVLSPDCSFLLFAFYKLKTQRVHYVIKPSILPSLELGAAVLPSLFQRWRRMEAVVMAEMEMRLMVGVTSTCSTLRPCGSSGALSGSEFFMAFPSCS